MILAFARHRVVDVELGYVIVHRSGACLRRSVISSRAVEHRVMLMLCGVAWCFLGLREFLGALGDHVWVSEPLRVAADITLHFHELR